MPPSNDNPFATSGSPDGAASTRFSANPTRSPHPLMSPQPLPPSSSSSRLHQDASVARSTFRDGGSSGSPNLSGFYRNVDDSQSTASNLFVSPEAPVHYASSPTPRAFTTTATTTPTTTNPVRLNHFLAQSARKDFQRHGSGITQSLEEMRRRDEARPGTLTCRLVSAVDRRDVSGKRYTAYVLHVKLPNTVELQLEHRYSEFAKLHDILQSRGIQLVEGGIRNGGGGSGGNNAVVFPKKHLAGRIGNWTPSLKWAPEQHDELVQYRKVQLDVWVCHVCERYNLGDLPHNVAHAILEFLTLSDRPPCEYDNPVGGGNDDDDEGEELTIYSQRGSNDGGKAAGLRWNNPISFTLGSSLRQACRIVDEMCSCSPRGRPFKETDQSIPLDLLHHAKGLIFLTVIKAGFVVSGRVGTGLLIARVDEPQRWSAPCALGTIGMGWGMLVGGDITHYLVVLTTQDAVEALLNGTVQLGTEVGVAVGPIGRGTKVDASASSSEWSVHPAYSYAHSKGLFVGMSLEGSILSARHDVNAKFYGRAGLTPDQVLDQPPPRAAEPLYKALGRALAMDIPEDGFRPSQFFHNKDLSSCNGSTMLPEDGQERLPRIDSYGRVSVTSDNLAA